MNRNPVRHLNVLHLLALEALLAVIESMEMRTRHANKGVGTQEAAPAEENELTVRLSHSSEDIRHKKRDKELRIRAAEQFNLKPRTGLEWCQKQGLLPDPLTPISVALFIRATPALDKTEVGQYLGKNDPFVIEVLGEFAQTFDFHEMVLDEALREFLSTFWLPGEAAQIDRIMQAFANRLFTHSPGPLINEDAAYVLAFSVIMLNTDLHNPSVPKKMSLTSWFKNNRKINDGGDVPPEYLERIYNTIKSKEIKLHNTTEFSGGTGAEASEEWNALIKRTRSASHTSFATSKVGSHDCDMFNMIWADTTTALSVVFETTGDEKMLAKVVEGFHSMVSTAEFHRLLEVPNAIVNSLFKILHKFLQIQLQKNPNDSCAAFGRSSKAQLAVTTVFSIVHAHGNCLRDGWRNILDWVIKMVSLKMISREMLSSSNFTSLSADQLPMARVSVAQPGSPDKSAEQGNSGIWELIFGGAGEEPPSEDDKKEMEQARARGTEKLAECNIPDVFNLSGVRLDASSVAHLVQTIMAVCTERRDLGNHIEAVVCLELLTWTVIKNKHRLELCWPPVCSFLEQMLSEDAPLSLSTERYQLTEWLVDGLIDWLIA